MKCNYLLTLLGILGILFSSVKVSDAQMTVAKIDQQPVEKQAENGIVFSKVHGNRLWLRQKVLVNRYLWIVTPLGVCLVKCWRQPCSRRKRSGIILTPISLT